MENKKQIRFPVNCIRLCFDSYGPDSCVGRICGVAVEHEKKFESMSDLIIKIDNIFNEIGQPQPHQVLRSFSKTDDYQSYNSKPKLYHTNEEIILENGRISTIDFIMISRHRAEWQGYIKNVDGDMVGRFNTTLESMSLISEGLK